MEGVVLSELFDLIGVEDVRDGALDLVRGAVILGHGELNDDEVPALHPEALAKFGGKEAEALLQRVQLAAWAFRIGIGGERGRPSEGNRGKIAATTLHPYAAPARREGGGERERFPAHEYGATAYPDARERGFKQTTAYLDPVPPPARCSFREA